MTSREVINTWFETGDKPTQAQFVEVIDSLFHRDEDSIDIDQVSGLQEALDAKQPISYPEVIAPITLNNAGSGYIIVADINQHISVRITYTIVRGYMREMGIILLECRANDLIGIDSEFDDCGFVFTKSISGTELRLNWADELSNGVNGQLYITENKRI